MGLIFQAWLTVAIVLCLAESFTGGLLVLPFGIGAGVAALLAALGVAVDWQWVAFVGVSSALLIIAQRFIVRR